MVHGISLLVGYTYIYIYTYNTHVKCNTCIGTISYWIFTIYDICICKYIYIHNIYIYTHSIPLFIGWTSISSTFLSNPTKRCITWSTAGGLGTSPSKRYDHSSKTRASQTSPGRRCGCVWWADGEDGTGRGRWESYLIECLVKHQIMGIWWIMALVGEELGIAWDYGKMNDLWFTI